MVFVSTIMNEGIGAGPACVIKKQVTKAFSGWTLICSETSFRFSVTSQYWLCSDGKVGRISLLAANAVKLVIKFTDSALKLLELLALLRNDIKKASLRLPTLCYTGLYRQSTQKRNLFYKFNIQKSLSMGIYSCKRYLEEK